MQFTAETLDDLMADILAKLLKEPFTVSASRGNSSELIGVMIQLNNPLARLSRTESKGKAFSALGELLWYLSGDNKLDFITYYLSKYAKESEDKKTVYGGYGPRLFNLREEINQVENILKLLRQRPSSRKAVIQLFDGKDINTEHKELPCTCTLQFLIRNGQLHMFTSMRSNDAFVGLPHDIFAFTMIQEIIAKSLNIKLGFYTHAVGSLHLYESNKSAATQYLAEGFQSTKKVMPQMPDGDPWGAIKQLQSAESSIRSGEHFDEKAIACDAYWLDLIRLLKILALIKSKNYGAIEEIKQQMHFPIYNTYIDQKTSKLKLKQNNESRIINDGRAS